MTAFILAGALAAGLAAQHQHPAPPPKPAPQHQHPAPPPKPQTPPAKPAQKPVDHSQHQMSDPGGWHFMQDAVAFLTWNRQSADTPAQGFDRGENEMVSQNWWMGMASRQAGRGELALSLMLSLDPLTQPGDGYGALFQTGETWEGVPIRDRQHPHDFLMQAAVMWRTPIGGYHLTLAAAPAGEPTLGPIAFMHRQSAAENLAAPLGHHTLDSTHIAHGVIAAGLDRGPWLIEGSIFRGKEPDEQRWDLMDPGALDSWAVRGWYRPSDAWEFQASHGFLNEPEALEHADVRRTTMSGSWLRETANGWTAASLIFGHNDKSEGPDNSVFLGEATHRVGVMSFFGRLEHAQVETDILLTGTHLEAHHDEEPLYKPEWVTAITGGLTREILAWRGFELAAGGDVTVYRVPDVLKSGYGKRPYSFHLFLRLRPPAPMGRMWNHVMTRPMTH